MVCLLRLLSGLCILLVVGCYAPLRSPGIPAASLSEDYRLPLKSSSAELNYALLTRDVPAEYVLGTNDLIKVEIAELVPADRGQPPRAPNQPRQGPFSHVVEALVDGSGKVLLPLVGSVEVGGKTLNAAAQAVADAYSSQELLDKPKIALTVVQPRTTRVMVMGKVAQPGVYELPKYENDIAHALSLAGGVLTEEADEIQVHRRYVPKPVMFSSPPLGPLRIPLRACAPDVVSPAQALLHDGDVVVVKSLPDEAFFVVGELSENNLVRFNLGRENCDLGNGFVLPKDRDIDVVTAVAMAGYIDPIDSPTTVTVHRTLPDGTPMLIRVDLIAARYDRRETVMVRAGDIIYLNPDVAWWFRRTFDRVIPDLITIPYRELMERLINPRGFNN